MVKVNFRKDLQKEKLSLFKLRGVVRADNLSDDETSALRQKFQRCLDSMRSA